MTPEAPDAARRAPELVPAVLRSDAELDAFCQDHFPAVRARFTDQMDRAARIRLLLTAVPDHQQLVAHLREFAPNSPAWGPQRPLWPYVLLAITLLIALVGGFLAWRMTMGRRVASAGGGWRPAGAAVYAVRTSRAEATVAARTSQRSKTDKSVQA